MQINMNAILSLANVKVKDSEDDFTGLEDGFKMLPGHLAQAVQEEIARTKAETTRQAAAEIVKLIQAVQSGITTGVARLRDARRKERAELAYIRNLKDRLDFANETSNYLALTTVLRIPVNSQELLDAVSATEKDFQTWLDKRGLGNKTKKSTPSKR